MERSYNNRRSKEKDSDSIKLFAINFNCALNICFNHFRPKSAGISPQALVSHLSMEVE